MNAIRLSEFISHYSNFAYASISVTAIVFPFNWIIFRQISSIFSERAIPNTPDGDRHRRYFVLLITVAGIVAITIWALYNSKHSIGAKTGTIIFASLFLPSVVIVTILNNLERAKLIRNHCHGWKYWFDGERNDKFRSCLKMANFRGQVSDYTSIASVQTILIVVVTVVPIKTDISPELHQPQYSDETMLASGVVAGTVFLIAWIFRLAFQRYALPGPSLISRCLSELSAPPRRERVRKSQANNLTSISRWRNDKHRQAFEVADAIERCLPILRKRLPSRQLAEVVRAYTRLCGALREESIRADVVRSSNRIQVFIWAAVALIVNDDLVSTSKRVAKIVPSDITGNDLISQSKFKRMTENINGFIETNSKMIKMIGILLVAMYYLGTGKMDNAITFIQKLIGG